MALGIFASVKIFPWIQEITFQHIILFVIIPVFSYVGLAYLSQTLVNVLAKSLKNKLFKFVAGLAGFCLAGFWISGITPFYSMTFSDKGIYLEIVGVLFLTTTFGKIILVSDSDEQTDLEVKFKKTMHSSFAITLIIIGLLFQTSLY